MTDFLLHIITHVHIHAKQRTKYILASSEVASLDVNPKCMCPVRIKKFRTDTGYDRGRIHILCNQKMPDH